MLFEFVLLGLLAQQEPRVSLLPASDLMEELGRFPLKNEERQQRVRELFERNQCPRIETVPVGKKEVPGNVACVVAGTSGRAIVVGAHFDKVKPGEGKVDNGAASVMLSAMAKAIAGQQRRHTFVFVGFAEEEVGLLGSAAFVKKGLPDKPGKEFLATVSAMVNIDSVAAGPTAVAVSSSDSKLANWLMDLGEELRLTVNPINVDQIGMSDSKSFADKKVRVVEVHSLTQQTLGILHTAADTMKAIQEKDYADTYRLLTNYLLMLDERLDAN